MCVDVECCFAYTWSVKVLVNVRCVSCLGCGRPLAVAEEVAATTTTAIVAALSRVPLAVPLAEACPSSSRCGQQHQFSNVTKELSKF